MTQATGHKSIISLLRAGGKNATDMMGTVQDQMDNLNKLLQDISDTTSSGCTKK